MDSTYTIRLTRGAYVVSEYDAERVLRAVENKEPHILVDADAIGDGLYRTPVRVVTAHILSIAENAQESDGVLSPLARPVLRAIPSA